MPVPDMRSTKMRLRVSSASASARTFRVSCRAFRHGSAKPSGRSRLHSAHAAVGDGQARPGHHLHELPQILAGLDHVEKDGEGPQLHRAGADAGEVVGDPGDLRDDDADVVAALGHRDSQQLLHRHAVAHVVDERRDVVEPVGVGDDAVVVHGLRHLLEAAVEIADLDFGVHDLLAVELGDDADDPVHGRVRGADVEEHVPGFEFANGVPCVQSELTS